MSWSVAAEAGTFPEYVQEPVPADAALVFGDQLSSAERYVDLLVGEGVRRGVIGPREGGRIWTRHMMNCAAVAVLIPPAASVLDLGSGAGLPGIPLALARPDVSVALLEPLARRTSYLADVVADLGLDRVAVVRGRAAEHAAEVGPAYDVVTARAVTDLATLHGWARRLLKPGGVLIAIKGAQAADELAAARHLLGRTAARVEELAAGRENTTTVVLIDSGHAE